MFDIATRPQLDPDLAADIYMDWRLARAPGVASYPSTNYVTTNRIPSTSTVVLATYTLELEDTLATAIVQSLFTDARAGRDDVLPAGASRRGWVGAEFLGQVDGQVDSWGSLLWLLRYSKSTVNVLGQAELYAREALAWLVRDGIAERVTAAAQWVGDAQQRLALRPQIYKPDNPLPVYDVLWGTSLMRWSTLQ